MKYKYIKYLTDWHTLSPTKDDTHLGHALKVCLRPLTVYVWFWILRTK